MKNRFVLTGGPGAGKTSLLNALATDGFKVIPEVARAIIRKEMETNGDAVPWKNKQLYSDKMLSASLLAYQQSIVLQSDEICFFDRGILDAVCYANMIGHTLTPEQTSQVKSRRYNSKVLLYGKVIFLSYFCCQLLT